MEGIYDGVKVYAGGIEYAQERAVLVLADHRGFSGPSVRLLANLLIDDGAYVVVPDLYDQSTFEDPSTFTLDMYHEKAIKVVERMKVLRAVKIALAGYGIGGVAMGISKREIVDCSFLMQPQPELQEEAVKGADVPMCIVTGQLDNVCTPATVKLYEENLRARGVLCHTIVLDGINESWSFAADSDWTDYRKEMSFFALDLLKNWLNTNFAPKLVMVAAPGEVENVLISCPECDEVLDTQVFMHHCRYTCPVMLERLRAEEAREQEEKRRRAAIKAMKAKNREVKAKK